ncbi:MAG: M48 family metallopeptidase [Pseudomonadota bacterium]
MADLVSMDARFFDGQSAIDQPVTVRFDTQYLEIMQSDTSLRWPYDGLVLARRSARDIRLTHEDFPDAILVLPGAAGKAALEQVAPDLISGRTANRQMVCLTVVMVLITGLVSAFLFFGVPALSGQLARMTSKDFERQMGENYASQINLFFRPCGGTGPATKALQPYLDDMATRGEVGFPISFTFVNVSAPNAFALPGGHVMATRGLVEAVGDDHEAFMAVMAHELGHVKSRDGMEAFYRNAGLSFTLEAITGGTGVAQQAVAIAAQVNQLQHTRAQEARADETAFAIMDAVGMDPAALSRAFEAISAKATDTVDGVNAENDKRETEQTPGTHTDTAKRKRKLPTWLSSHPATDARISQARERAQPGAADFMSDEDWAIIRTACTGEQPAEGIAERIRNLGKDKTENDSLLPRIHP